MHARYGNAAVESAAFPCDSLDIAFGRECHAERVVLGDDVVNLALGDGGASAGQWNILRGSQA